MKRTHHIPVAEHVNKVLADIAKKMGGGKVRVGFMEGAVDDQGTPIAAIAYWNEFGHEGQFPSPPRPFFRRMVIKESPGWPTKMAALAKSTNFDGKKVLNIMGADIAEALQESIITFNDPPLSPTTLMLRAKFWTNPQDVRITDVLAAQKSVASGEAMASGTQAKPFITFHSFMLHAVTYEVEGK